MKHPIQPLEQDGKDGTVRFKRNHIIDYLFDTSALSLNDLAMRDFPQNDWEQLAQLLGYSLSGYGTLSYVSDETYNTAEKMYEAGLDERDAKIEHLEGVVEDLRTGMKNSVATLYGIHPDDLTDGHG